MKRISIIWVSGLALLALAGCATAEKPVSSGGGTTVTASGCGGPAASTATGRQCTYPDGLSGISYPQVDQYYWQPAAGYFAVTESYYKPDSPGRSAGAWAGRTISVGDGCVIDDNWTPSVTTPPTNCMDSRTGNYRGATATEQRSVLKFWQLMTKYVPSADR